MPEDGELKANPKTGVIDDPKYPCYKVEGLCRIRFLPPEKGRKFVCIKDPVWCPYLKKSASLLSRR